MKKNLFTIIVIALLIVNVILSALLVFVVVPTTNKTNHLITQVASIIDLELESQTAQEIRVEDIDVYNIEKQLTLTLKSSEGDTKPHYAAFNISLSLDKTSGDFETLSPTVATNESVIKEIVMNCFSTYTKDEVFSNIDNIKEEVIKQLRDYFKSDFIINVSFSNLVVQ